eukprot:526822_1
MSSTELETKTDEIFSLQELNSAFHPTLNQINKSLHSNKFSIRNRLLSIYDDYLFVNSVHNLPYFKKYPLTANLRCGEWYVYPINNSCYFKSTDGHFNKWSFNLRRLNPNTLKLIIQNKGIIIVDSTRKGKVFPDSLQRTIPIWCHVLNNIFYILSKQSNHKNIPISLKMSQWITDSEKEQIQELTNNEWIKKVLSSNIINELSQIQKAYSNNNAVLRLEPFWINRLCDCNAIKLEIEQKIQSNNNILPIILLSASRPMHIIEITNKKYIQMINEINKLNFEYIQGAGDDHEHWSKGITPNIFWKNYKLFLKCNSNQSCIQLLQNILNSQKSNELIEFKQKCDEQSGNNNILVNLNELINDYSSANIE